MKIALVEDNEAILKKEKKELQSLLFELNASAEIFTFPSGKALLFDMDDEKQYDIYITDIELSDMSGINLMNHIRQTQPEAYIIFLTAHDKYAVSGYRAGGCRYVLKGDEAALREALAFVVKSLTGKERFIINQSGEYAPLYCSDIIYVYREGKYACLVTNGREWRVRSSLKAIAEKLPEDAFVFINRAELVNIGQIQEIQRDKVIMKNDVELRANMDRMTEIRKRINRYWGKILNI